MSTKIYNGFCFEAPNPVDNWRALGQSKPHLQALVDAKHCKLLAQRIAHKADTWAIERANGVLSSEQWQAQCHEVPWLLAEYQLMEEQRVCRADHRRSPLIDCDVELFLRVHPVDGRILGYLQEERVGAYTSLVAQPGCREYGYWDNTDPPEDMPEHAWEQRRLDWDQVLQDSVPCVTLRLEPSFMAPEQVAKAIPSLFERARRIAVAEQETKALEQARAQQQHESRHSLSWAARCLRQLHEQLNTSGTPQQQACELRTAELSRLLHPNLAPHLDKPWRTWLFSGTCV